MSRIRLLLFKKSISIFLLFSCWPIAVSVLQAHSEKETWPQNTIQEVRFESSILDRTLVLQIQLPTNYESADEVYPVLYYVDGKVFSRMLNIAKGNLFRDKMIGPMISVGVDAENYTAGDWGSSRGYLLTPTSSDASENFRKEDTGGGKDFLRCFREELIPFIEKEFRTKSDGRTLAGHSLGGLFTLFASLEDPNLFDCYLVSSPSLYWDDRVIFRKEAEYARLNSDLPARIYLSMGSLEIWPDRNNWAALWIQELDQILKARSYPNLSYKTEIHDEEGHSTAMPLAYLHGLRYLHGSSPTAK